MQVLRNGQWQEDDWECLPDPQHDAQAVDVPNGAFIVPHYLWSRHGAAFLQRSPVPGLMVEGDTELETLREFLSGVALIAVYFPVFTDGRCYSQARLLRERYGYRGELRAMGEVLRDQLFYMLRCGIDAFALPKDAGHNVLQSFTEISVRYQAAGDPAWPPCRRR